MPAKILQKIHIFDSLNHEDVLAIAPFFYTREYYAGAEIYKQGEPSEELLIIVSGEIIINCFGKNLFKISVGDFFGESAIFNKAATHNTSAIALDDVLLLAIRRENFYKLKQFYPHIALVLTEHISATLSKRIEQDTISLGRLVESGNHENLISSLLSLVPSRRGFIAINDKNKDGCLRILESVGINPKELPREIPIDTDIYLEELCHRKHGKILLDKKSYLNKSSVAYAKQQMLGKRIDFRDNEFGVIVLTDKIDGDFDETHFSVLDIMADKLSKTLQSHTDYDLEDVKREYVGM